MVRSETLEEFWTKLGRATLATQAERNMAVQIEKKARAQWITWDRPPLNVLDLVLLRELDQQLTLCAADSTVDVVVLQGAGLRAFSAGVDIKDHTTEKVPE